MTPTGARCDCAGAARSDVGGSVAADDGDLRGADRRPVPGGEELLRGGLAGEVDGDGVPIGVHTDLVGTVVAEGAVEAGVTHRLQVSIDAVHAGLLGVGVVDGGDQVDGPELLAVPRSG